MTFHFLLVIYQSNKGCLNSALNVSQNFLNSHSGVYDIVGHSLNCLVSKSVCY